jgi:competence protein ComEC
LALPWSERQLLFSVGWIPAVVGLAGWAGYRFGRSRINLALAVGVGAGFVYAWMHAWIALEARLPACVDVDYHQVRIELVSKPIYTTRASDHRQSVKFQGRLLDSLASPGCRAAPGARLQLSWFDPPRLQRGDIWRVNARLRQPWSYQNPGGFDYERWLFAQRLSGTGYVRKGLLLQRHQLVREEQTFAGFLGANAVQHAGLMLALTRGDAGAISGDQWEAFRATGTVHLMVVSGLHVGLVVGVSFLIFRVLLRGVPVLVSYERLAGGLALLAAAGFVFATGTGVPALRAWLMAALLMVSIMAGRRVSRFAVFVICMALVLLLDPLVVHQVGFYLSFGAVAVLMGFFTLHQLRGGWPVQLLVTQSVLFGFLTPALALQQASVAGVGSLSNLVAVPLLGLLLPLLLAASLCWWWWPAAALQLLAGAGVLLDALMVLIELAASLPPVPSGSGTWLLSGLSFAAALLLSTRTPRVWWPVLLLAWLSWLVPQRAAPPLGEFSVAALDVGQGSAIVVETANHRLLFDTGPGYPSGFDLGASVVVPSLLRTGTNRIDALVLSHQDLDHTGGYRSVLAAIVVDRVFASFPLPDFASNVPLKQPAPSNPASFKRCQTGVSWQWDEVHFEFLNDPASSPGNDNDRSCVLRIAARHSTALLSGDISRRVERRLSRAWQLRADLVMAPHHGSNSSSSPVWIAAAQPDWVLFSAPRRSRYGHPHPAVIQRHQEAGARVAVTGYQGAIVWRSWRKKELRVRRRIDGPYWINPPVRVPARGRQGGGSSGAAG